MPVRNLNLDDIEESEMLLRPFDAFIVGVDPGVTTGVSVIGFEMSHNIPLPSEVEIWGSTQFSYGGSGNSEDILGDDKDIEQTISKMVGDIAKYLSHFGDVIVSIEDFIIRKMNTSRDFLAPVRITAGIRQEIFGDKNIGFVSYTPADAKAICNDKRMDLWGYEIRTQKDRHSRDADRHAVLTLRRIKENPRLVDDLLR